MKLKRDALVDVYLTEALLLLMEKKDYKDISVTELCEKAGVTRMSFYRNFSDKEEILSRKVREITDTFLAQSDISYRDDPLEDYFAKLFTHLEKNRDLCLKIYRAGLFHLVKNEFDRVFLSIYRDEYDEYKSVFIAGGIYNVFLLWLIQGCREKPGELAARLVTILQK